ncbi:MAG: radical SAM protein [Thermodesulfobacteriota bacterium]
MKNRNYFNNPGALKIDLMLRGAAIEDPEARARACGATGIDILLPQKVLVNIPCEDWFTVRSPYVIKKAAGKKGYILTNGSESVAVSILDPPEFYTRKTASGVRFGDIAVTHGSYTVITPDKRCGFFKSSAQCRYCAGNFSRDASEADAPVYTVEEVLETAGAVLKEKASGIIYLSIGFSEGDDGGIKFLEPYVRAIKSHFNCLVAVEALPPASNEWIERAYAFGVDSMLYNLDIFDKELFSVICPGRAGLIGRQRTLDALKYAAGIFPSGTVASHLIVGLEPPGSTIQGIDFLTDSGVVPILPIFRPSRERPLDVTDLEAEVIIPVYQHLYRTLKKKGINFNWVRDISMVTTPVEGGYLLTDEDGAPSLLDNFYDSRLGMKAAWGLSALRRRLRVKKTPKEDPPEGS